MPLDKPPTILIIDDEERIRSVFSRFLEPAGYRTVMASGGEDGLAKAVSEKPDVILLDVRMPDMDGFEVLKALRDNDCTHFIPVVMVTGMSDVNHRVRALELGADDFLAKPVEMIELMARVRSLLKVKAYNDYRLEYQTKLEVEVAAKTEQINLALESAKSASLETIYRLSKASEYKDEDTGEHILRISQYTSAIARGLGFSAQEIETLLYAAPMHDIGKIGIPDYILLKPAKLDAAEWEIMKQHTVIGARILSKSSSGFMNMAEIIAISHHERWDGGGYPHGLKGDEIPLVGRITALADVFDALTSKRPYKEAFPLEKAFAILREGDGSHFDPTVVEAFFKAQEEILNIKLAFQDSAESLFAQMHKLALQNLVDPKAAFVVGAKRTAV